jgi:type I restriction enzyme S subunit
LRHVLVSDEFHAQFMQTVAGVGGSLLRARRSQVAEIAIPLPSLSEQRRIAAILDQADALRAKRRAALARLDEMARAIFVEMFGDPIANNRGFRVNPLSDLIDPARPITYGILMPGPDYPGGVSYVRVVDIANGTVNLQSVRKTSPEIAGQYERSRLQGGDLLISIRGHVGRVAVTPPDLDGANITQDTARLAATDVNPLFLKGVLETDGARQWMERRTKGAAVKGINLGDLRRLPVPRPPEEVQLLYAERIRKIHAMRTGGVVQGTQLQLLFTSLQHRAFRGEL